MDLAPGREIPDHHPDRRQCARISAVLSKDACLTGAGTCFAAGVFAAYVALGFGLLKAVKMVSVSSGVAAGLAVDVGLFALALGVLSLRDCLAWRKNRNPGNIKLKLPEGLRVRVRALLSRKLRGRNLGGVALLLGMGIALLEAASTGEIYLPTLMCISRDSTCAGLALGYLVLYGLMFVAPLLAVFALAYTGVTHHAMAAFTARHVALSKALLAAVFSGLGLLLLWSACP